MRKRKWECPKSGYQPGKFQQSRELFVPLLLTFAMPYSRLNSIVQIHKGEF